MQKCTLLLLELSGRRFTIYVFRLWVSWQFLESSSFVQHRGWCHVMGIFLQLCVILLIYFLLQKSKITAAVEYAVAVLAVGMRLCQLQEQSFLFHCLIYCYCLYCSVKYIGFRAVDISVQVYTLLSLSKIHPCIDAKYTYVQSSYLVSLQS